MSFFVPYAETRHRAELLWDYAREQLENRYLPTTHRRIRALVLNHEGVAHLIAAVGSDTPVAEGDPVLVILEASDEDDVVYICTLSQVAKDRAPYWVPLNERWRVVDF